jgi:hypothetical protein
VHLALHSASAAACSSSLHSSTSTAGQVPASGGLVLQWAREVFAVVEPGERRPRPVVHTGILLNFVPYCRPTRNRVLILVSSFPAPVCMCGFVIDSSSFPCLPSKAPTLQGWSRSWVATPPAPRCRSCVLSGRPQPASRPETLSCLN